MRWFVALFPLLVAASGAARAQPRDPAEPSDDARRIAVLPLATNDASLEIYSAPIAREVGKHLRAILEIDVDNTADAGSVSSVVDLVVDGRITKIGRDRISLEAKVRDASISQVVGAVTAGQRPLVEVDRAARDLADKLAPVIRGWRREQPKNPYRLESARPARSADGPGIRRAAPLLVVLRPTGSAAAGVVPVQAQASQAVYAFAHRLGVRSVATSDQPGDADPVKIANAIRASEARYGLTIEIAKVSYDFRGVLSARGEARIQLVDRDGLVVLSEKVGTDTVVGARGDRHSALVYMVAEQALDIAGPKLRKALDL